MNNSGTGQHKANYRFPRIVEFYAFLHRSIFFALIETRLNAKYCDCLTLKYFLLFRFDIPCTSWAFLELHTSAECPDEKQAYAAGYLEGYLTRDLIWYHWQNMLRGSVICRTLLSLRSIIIFLAFFNFKSNRI